MLIYKIKNYLQCKGVIEHNTSTTEEVRKMCILYIYIRLSIFFGIFFATNILHEIVRNYIHMFSQKSLTKRHIYRCKYVLVGGGKAYFTVRFS